MSETNLVAVVTGASRGIGRGIAIALGASAATVYVVGRTIHEDAPRGAGEAVLPGTKRRYALPLKCVPEHTQPWRITSASASA